MCIATVKGSSVLELAGVKKGTPIKSLKDVNVSNVFGADGTVKKTIDKINNNGNNPFGVSKVSGNENSIKEGPVKKIYQSFDKIDADRNGFLSSREIINKMKDNNFKSESAAAASALVSNHSKIRNLSDDEFGPELKGVSKNDLVALDKLENTDTVKEKVENTFYNSVYKISSARSFFDSNDKFITPKKAEDISYKSVQQGGAGDCYFLAALASQAQRNPQKIVDMIKDNGDGTFNIKFSDKTVKITAPTDAELGLYADGAGWVALIEKGYAVYRNESALLKKENPFDKSGGGSILVGRSIKELTGNSYDADVLPLTSKNSTRTKLQTATDNNKLMTASVKKELIGKAEFNLPDGHVYTVLGFDSKTDKVQIRNPWGHTEAQDDKGTARDGYDDGIFELSLEEFYKAFTMIAYEK